jgi:hypothetical protein
MVENLLLDLKNSRNIHQDSNCTDHDPQILSPGRKAWSINRLEGRMYPKSESFRDYRLS